MKLKTGDKVVVIAGKDKGKEGKIVAVDKKNNRVMVEGVNMVSKHTKPNAQNQQGGIVSQEAKFDASNAMLVCPKCGAATRVGHKQGELDGHKTSIRVCKKCGHEF